MAELPLHGKRGEGKVALCDDADVAFLSQYRWHLSKNGYPRTRIPEAGTAGRVRDMHQLLTDERGQRYRDHVSGDKLDNRRSNLRACTQQENSFNRARHKNNRSGYKGVTRWKGQWRATITKDGAQLYLGLFPHPVLAAIAYNAAALALFGPFARVNVLPLVSVAEEVAADAAD
ncbi:HNH endonuclease [Deinococcus wulumuqiensis]|uniref:AP2/ERF domain-containing protein n=1 Tax=Deinococcus wulumuqiensis TaxID=980427 RepID=A0AAV4K421_9DEIO|nr:HNH endonuclease [Deinococcus wulumuqiensis]QII20228.1 hypothetical protein G6R31_05170 [Deinococcus wulumuqiensis R12]GGI75019.1 hypothetical protein GCM10010914_06520 [Deinococcus wulumuqiensis]GGP28668.1 hypothetical protein GCM10008021_03190 [Deinococcus wulumuqiensis]